jgi:hypothetical protein
MQQLTGAKRTPVYRHALLSTYTGRHSKEQPFIAVELKICMVWQVPPYGKAWVAHQEAESDALIV